MRFLFKLSLPVEAGNAAAQRGFEAIQQIVAEQKPEAIYFAAEDGKRTAFMIKSMNDASELPGIAEPWMLALNASIEVTPAMVVDDLMKAGPAIGQAVKKYGE